MQRKNRILKPHKRHGMAMVMAISVIILMATIMAVSLSLSSSAVKQSTNLYLYEQAQLLSKSASEYALLRIAQDGPCTHTNDLNFKQDGIFDVNISLRYIYTNPSPCTASQTYTTVTTPEQNGSILLDVTVSVDQNLTGESIRYCRRTLQKL